MRWGDVLLLLRLLKTWVCAGLLVCMHIRMCSALGCTGGGAREVSRDQSRSQCHRYCRRMEPCPSAAASCRGWLRWRGWPQCWSAVRRPCQTEHGPSGSCDEGCCGPSQWRDRKPPGRLPDSLQTFNVACLSGPEGRTRRVGRDLLVEVLPGDHPPLAVELVEGPVDPVVPVTGPVLQCRVELEGGIGLHPVPQDILPGLGLRDG